MGRVATRYDYVDYLLGTSGHISAINLTKVLEGHYCHDQICRMLYTGKVDNKTFYLIAKRLIEAKEVVFLSIDGSIQEKPFSEVNGILTHWDHTQSRG